MINQTLLDAQSVMVNETMISFLLIAVFITAMQFLGLSNYANSLTVGIASIMLATLTLFIMEIMGYLSL